jgi:3'(2'), 5'-bisphosphate nucleotidase
MAAHEIIVAGLSALTPQIPVLSEESHNVSIAERRRWESLWLVDPLDGTRQFIRRNDEFSVNIALIRRHRPVLGLILIPVGGTCYFACHGQGAFKRLAGRPAGRIHARRISKTPIQVAGSRGFNSRRLKAYLEKLGQHDYVGMGSSIKSCLVAEGKIDLYPRFGPTAEWDTAAAQIIVEEAGGHLTDARLQPLRYNARSTLINPDFFVFGDASHDWSQYLPVINDPC